MKGLASRSSSAFDTFKLWEQLSVPFNRPCHDFRSRAGPTRAAYRVAIPSIRVLFFAAAYRWQTTTACHQQGNMSCDFAVTGSLSVPAARQAGRSVDDVALRIAGGCTARERERSSSEDRLCKARLPRGHVAGHGWRRRQGTVVMERRVYLCS